MKGINKVILVGVLGQNPDIRATSSGACVANLSLATNESYQDKRSGERVNKTTWHNCIAFGKTAELIDQFCRKGMKMYIDGSIDYQKYEKDGETKYITKIMVKDFILLSSIEGNKNENEQQTKKNYKKSETVHTDTFEDDELPF